MLDLADFEAWFRLLETPGVGRDTARRLLAACGSPAAVFRTAPATLRGLVSPAVAQALQGTPPDWPQRLATAHAWLNGGPKRCAITLGDADYPPLLLQTADPPVLLYVHGQVQALASRGVAMVGSRHATAQGADNARAFAAALAEVLLTVFSGLAQGIDAAAHEGALQGGGCTVAVVGTGPDRVYPPQHAALAARIVQHGAVVSEFAPGMPGLPEHFPMRNRIIAGLSLGTLVVEAAVRSGSLITARLALEAGREVFAVPGSIHAPQSKGCHQLIKQGAKLVETAQDIVEELQGPRQHSLPLLQDDAGQPGGAPSASDTLLAQALGSDPVTLDALMDRTGFSAAELSAHLLDLELDGQVARLPGGLYQRRYKT